MLTVTSEGVSLSARISPLSPFQFHVPRATYAPVGVGQNEATPPTHSFELQAHLSNSHF